VYEIELEFLGKDSMLFKQTIDFRSYGDRGVRVFENLSEFCRRKKPQENVFDTLTVMAQTGSLSTGLVTCLGNYSGKPSSLS
jgi:DNA topoisomerase I